MPTRFTGVTRHSHRRCHHRRRPATDPGCARSLPDPVGHRASPLSVSSTRSRRHRGGLRHRGDVIQQQVAQASPDYLAESRAASAERARTIALLTERHQATLATILGTPRSEDLDDRRARITASETAVTARIALQSAGAANRELSEEAVTTAFARLRAELRPLLRDRKVYVEYADPPADGRPLPGEIAHAARAMVPAVVLCSLAQDSLTRLRIGWDCDGENVLIEVRDQDPGTLDRPTLAHQLEGRLHTLAGHFEIEIFPGGAAELPWRSRWIHRNLDPTITSWQRSTHESMKFWRNSRWANATAPSPTNSESARAPSSSTSPASSRSSAPPTVEKPALTTDSVRWR
jgi:hypothetical protein